MMDKGSFHRVPVVDGGKLVGIVSDRDLRQHTGTLAQVKVNGAMTTSMVSVTPTTILEDAANLLVSHKIGALPVVDAASWLESSLRQTCCGPSPKCLAPRKKAWLESICRSMEIPLSLRQSFSW